MGTDVPAATIVDTVKENQAPFPGLSALLTTTMRVMGEAIEELKRAGRRDKVRLLIGGALTSDDFAKEVGADSYCKDAFEGIEVLKDMSPAT